MEGCLTWSGRHCDNGFDSTACSLKAYLLGIEEAALLRLLSLLGLLTLLGACLLSLLSLLSLLCMLCLS